MSQPVSKRFVLIGLPETGKTSFLAALWYLVQHAQVKHGLTLDRLEGDSAYLNEIADLWVSFHAVTRTPMGVGKTVSMTLRNADTADKMTLTFPDLSGESFRLQWVDRQFTADYDQFLKSAAGGMLFISPLNYKKANRIDMAAPLIEAMGDAHADEVEEAPTPWDATETVTQVQLVELLQFMAGRDYFKLPFRVALVISAWDQLTEMNKTPEKWLSDEMPLLAQFLQSNRKAFDYTVYGISAQGGDYSQTAAELANVSPSERIQIAGSNVTNLHDLTEPLLWLMR